MPTENQHTEFKSHFCEEVIETLTAFANSKGGKVLVGVGSDERPVNGFTVGPESIPQWVNEVKNKTQPTIIPDVDVVQYEGSKVVAFRIQEYPIKPVACRGRYYKRVENSNHLLSVNEVVNLHLQALNSSWDADPDATHNLDDIAMEKVQAAIDAMRSNGLTINEIPLAFMNKYELLREGKLTNAAYLMFKKHDSYLTTIELGRFQTPTVIKDTARTKADILTQIEQVIDFVKKHINRRLIFTGEAQNTPKWQYPLEAIREIVVNMVVHRDYRSSADSIVKIFDNQIEFYNPGRLPDEITVSDLLSGNYKSTPRNKLIADVCKDMRLIEKYGSSIRRIADAFTAEGLPAPRFENISDGFQVTVFASETETWENILPETTQKTTQKTTRKTTQKTTQKIIAAIQNDATITTAELIAVTGLTLDGVNWNLKKLKCRGLIERIGPDKGGYWKVKETV